MGGSSICWRWSVCFRKISGYLLILASGAETSKEKAQAESDLSFHEHAASWMKSKKLVMDADELEAWGARLVERENARREAHESAEVAGEGESDEQASGRQLECFDK